MRPILIAFALILCLASAANAQSDADRAAVQDVIRGQLDAFRRDDAGAAYGHAAPVIQRLFPTQDAFMTMVERAYPPVYRSREHAFAEIRETPGGGLAQGVRLRDEAGEDWLAVYTLERQPDGAWRITGCTLERAPTQGA